MRRLSIKMRTAIFAGMIVLATAVAMALMSAYNARWQITSISENTPVAADGIVYEPAAEVYRIPEDASAYVEARKRFDYASFLYTTIIVTAGMAAAYVFAGKALKPVTRLNQMIADITEENLGRRLPRMHTNDEISALTDSFNAMLDRLDESFIRQKRFSFNAAHELKTPVAVIKTSLQALKLDDSPEPDDYREAFRIISRSAERLASLIDDLLALTNENSELPVEVISLNAVLVMAVRDLMPQYEKKEIEVEYEFPAEECFVECVETLAWRLFYNLIENGFKYNRQGGKLTVGISGDAGNYKVRVKDTGIGIPQDKLRYIWDAFYCVDPSHSRKMGGAGLGLSVVKEIAGRFGWKLYAESQKGIYTEFTVECKRMR